MGPTSLSEVELEKKQYGLSSGCYAERRVEVCIKNKQNDTNKLVKTADRPNELENPTPLNHQR